MSNKITFTSTIVDGVEKTSAEFAYDTLNDITNDSAKKKLGITPVGNKDITTTTQTDVTEYATAQVVDADLIAENIKKDVDILGVTGSYEGIEPTGNINIISMQQVDVTNYATAQVVDADIIAENIKSGVDILGVTGNFTSDGNATANDMLLNKTAYVNGTKITGNIANGSATTPTTTITANPTVTGSVSGSNYVVTASVSASQSVTPTIVSGYVTSGTAGTISASGSATMNITIYDGTVVSS